MKYVRYKPLKTSYSVVIVWTWSHYVKQTLSELALMDV